MGKVFGDGSEETSKEEQDRLAQQRENQAEKMKPEDKTTLEVWHGGKKYTMPYREFVAKYGDPRKYKTDSLIKTIVQYDITKNMGL